jgi:hypothetical protein
MASQGPSGAIQLNPSNDAKKELKSCGSDAVNWIRTPEWG